jgi:hypothetical protein
VTTSQGRITMNRISDLIKKPQRAPYSFHHVSTQLEGAMCKPESRLSLDTKSGSALTLNFPDSITVRKEFLLFMLPYAWYFVIVS